MTDVLQNGDVEYVCVVSDEADSNSDCSVTLWLLEGDRVKTKASSNLPCGDVSDHTYCTLSITIHRACSSPCVEYCQWLLFVWTNANHSL